MSGVSGYSAVLFEQHQRYNINRNAEYPQYVGVFMKDSDEMCAACDGLIPLLLCAGAGTYGSDRQGRIIFHSTT
jgi:hypothetical protein